MKKVLFFCLIGGGLIMSCGGGKAKKDKAVKESKEEIEEVVIEKEIADSTIYAIQYSADREDSSVFVLHYQYYIHPNSPAQDSVNKRILDKLISATEIEYHAPEQNAVLDHRTFRKQLDYFYRMSVEGYEEQLEYSGYQSLYGFDYSITIDTTLAEYTQLTIDEYSNTGGAHGNGYTSYDFISNKTGELINLKKLVQNVKSFNKMVEPYFRKQNGIEANSDLVELGYWFEKGDFSCNSNFYIKNDTLCFLFNSYEIACYAQGPSGIKVPLKEVKKVLKIDTSKK